MIDKTISHYKILEKLGEGGMGVVYKALDTKLNRHVALKFLPFSITENSEEKTRFFHEAQAISALNHPHIATIHDVEEMGEDKFIVLEYIEGGTLRAKLHGQRLDLKEVLEYAIQIAAGLAHAHKKDVVHRDLKTENLMFTGEGQIKITDFGLAKLKNVVRVTRTGSTVGTLAYMSPEQAQGMEVDHRSDIFSFGIVLYEMATGELPFKGVHEAALLYELVNVPAPPMKQTRADLSEAFERIVSKAMEKKRDERYQHVDEMMVDLKRLKKDLELKEILARVGMQRFAEMKTSRRAFIAATAVVVLVALAIGGYMLQSSSLALWSQAMVRTLKTPSWEVKDPAISGDGNWVAYVATDVKGISNIYIMHTGGGEPKRVTNETTLNTKSSLCFSPDAKDIIYAQSPMMNPGICCPYDIYSVPALGGTPRKLIGHGQLPAMPTDGKSIGFFRYTGKSLTLWLANAEGKEEKKITDVVAPIHAYNLTWSPDSRKIAFLRSFLSSNKGYTEIFVCDAAGNNERQLTFDQKMIEDFCWSPNGQIIFNSTRGGNYNLWTMPAKGGKPQRLTLGSGWHRFARVSHDAKRLVYLDESQTINLWAANLETKTLKQLTYEEGRLYEPSFSPDGNRILYLRDNPLEGAGSRQAIICNKDGSEPLQVTHEREEGHYNYRWSGDGRAIAYTVVKRDTIAGKTDSVHFDESIMVRELATGQAHKMEAGILLDWSPDGKYLLYLPPDRKTRKKLMVDLKALAQNQPIKQIEVWETPPIFSHDSQSIIYADSIGLWIMPVKDGQAKLFFKRPPGELFYWLRETPDGKAITYLQMANKERFAKLLKVSKLGIGPEKFLELPYGNFMQYTISPDMTTVVFSRQQATNKLMMLENSR
ncbi:MAG: protein kinase domain-containing protein [bacterium]